MLGDAEDAGRYYIDQPLSRSVLLKQRTDSMEGHGMTACKNPKGNIVTQYKASSDLSLHLVHYRNTTFKLRRERSRKVKDKLYLPCRYYNFMNSE
jgi:endonuclease/exonuclease/phosphatase (EEP) superfamily protein YafD